MSSTPVVAAYYPSWKIYKGCKPSDLRLDLLSYVNYAFARINEDGTIRSLDAKADFSLSVDGASGCINAFREVKRERYPHLRIMLSIGGGSGSGLFPKITADDKKLAAFCRSARDWLDKFDLDGIDIDWEHPSNPEEGLLFLRLIETLRGSLPRPRYTLTAALPAGEWCLRNIDLTRLLSSHSGDPYLDYLHVMTYDFSGPWTEFSGHQAQLRAPDNPSNAFERRSIMNVTKYLTTERSVDPARIVIGIPTYGRAFLGVEGPGQRFINHPLGSNDIFDYRDLPRPGTEEVVDLECGAASCLGEDDGWVTYDCPTTVRMKGDFVRAMGLGGLFFWTGSSDAQDESRSLVVAGYESLHGC